MTGVPRVQPYGDRALLLEVGSTEEVVAVAESLRADRALAGLLDDVVPGARTILLVVRARVPVVEVRGALATSLETISRSEPTPDAGPPRAPATAVEVPVTYDGPDLAEVARLTGLSEGEVVAAHTGGDWRVAFGGFAPGFAYLVGGDPRLRVPRRESPRTSVPAGAVGLAGEFSGVYPRPSPGGWQLVGRTALVMWDAERDPPALLAPGATVRFVEA